MGQLAISGLGRVRSQLSGFNAAGARTAGVASAMGSALSLAGAGLVTAGIAAAVVSVEGVRAFSEFDAAMTQSLAIMGDVSTAMRRDMSDAARAVARETSFSANDAAESFFYLASAGMDAEQSIAALPAVATFAQAGMFDMARATDILTDAQSALGLAVEDPVENLENMVRVGNTLVAANTLANASVEEFGQALVNRAAARMRQFNISVEEGVSVLAAFADQGVKGRVAGQQLNILLRDLTSTAINNAEAFDTLGISVFDTEGELRSVADIIESFENRLEGASAKQRTMAFEALNLNQRVGDALSTLLGTSQAIRDYEEDIRNAGNIMEIVAARQLEHFRGQLGLLGSNIKDVFLLVGQELVPTLTKAFTELNEVFSEVEVYVLGTISFVKEATKTVWGFRWAVYAMNPALASWRLSVSNMMDDVKDMGEVRQEIRKTEQQFAESADNMLRESVDNFGEIESVLDNFVNNVNMTVDEMEQLTEILRGEGGITSLGESGRHYALMQLPEAVRDMYADASMEALETLIFIDRMTDGVEDFIAVLNEGTGSTEEGSSELQKLLDSLAQSSERTVSAFQQLNTSFSDNLALSRALRNSNLSNLDVLYDITEQQNRYKESIDSGTLSVREHADALENVLRINRELLDTIGLDKDQLELAGAGDYMIPQALELGAAGEQAVGNTTQRTVDTVRRSFTDELAEIRPQLEREGARLVESLASGTLDAGDIMDTAIRMLARHYIMPGLLDVLGIASPSKWMMARGKDIVEGLALGIRNSSGMVESAMGVITDPIQQGISGTQQGLQAMAVSASSMSRDLSIRTENLPAPLTPMEASRDYQWQELLRESLIVSRNQGFRG